MKKSSTLLLGVLLLHGVGGGAILSAGPILIESFPADQRLTQDLPSTSAWYVSNADALTYGSGSLTLDTDGSQQALTYFTDSGTVDLAVGERLEIQFGFQVAGAASSGAGIRIGLFDSGGSRVGADTSGLSDPAYNVYSGYGAWFNPNTPNTGGMSIRERTGTSDNLTGFAGAWTTRESGGPAITIESGVSYTGLLVADRVDTDSVTLSFSLAGGALTTPTSVSWTDEAGALTGFDTFLFYQNLTAGDSFSLMNVDISVIPEPSTYALIFGGLALAAVVLRRRFSRGREPAW